MDIFEQTANTSELAKKKLFHTKLLIFIHYQLDFKEINYPFQWWRKYETMFHIVNFLAHKFLGIVKSKIEKEKIKIFRTCLLQWDNF
jgi:hypothetical protein